MRRTVKPGAGISAHGRVRQRFGAPLSPTPRGAASWGEMMTFVEVEPGRYVFEVEALALLELHLVHLGGETLAEWRTVDGAPLIVFTPAEA